MEYQFVPLNVLRNLDAEEQGVVEEKSRWGRACQLDSTFALRNLNSFLLKEAGKQEQVLAAGYRYHEWSCDSCCCGEPLNRKMELFVKKLSEIIRF